MDARAEVMTRVRRAAEGLYASRKRSAGFIHPARVEAAIELAAEGAIRCWTETVGANRAEVLVCELAPPRGLPRPCDPSDGRAA